MLDLNSDTKMQLNRGMGDGATAIDGAGPTGGGGGVTKATSLVTASCTRVRLY